MARKRAIAGTPSRRRGFSTCTLLACSAGVVLLAVGAALLDAASSTSAALMRVSVFVVHYNPLVERKRQLQRQPHLEQRSAAVAQDHDAVPRHLVQERLQGVACFSTPAMATAMAIMTTAAVLRYVA